MFSVDRYLQRLGIATPIGPPSRQLLTDLQLAHLIKVPFENLHVFHRRGVRLDVDWAYSKIVEDGRGGWCFELNSCFAELLRRLDFKVDCVSCQVWEADLGDWGPPDDHLALVVHLDGVRWFVDVGFGDCCIHPLRLQDGDLAAVPRPARIELCDGTFTLTELMSTGGTRAEWQPQLRVDLRPAEAIRFDRRSNYLQTEPGLSWTEKAFATRALDAAGSRVTLRMDVLRQRVGTAEFVEQSVARESWAGVLLHHFSLVDSNVR
ncbi:MAG: arylamine N-acetyltransferase [Actinobacteria bacterium]|nr:arylamine N-acetyltransferase [Actinomycetota bacterium]